MKTVIGVIMGIVLVLAFQKIWNERSQPEKTVATTTAQDIPVTDNIPEDFIDFYTRFHSDSIYQINHINFPLKGLPANADSLMQLENNFYWQKEDWKMHRPFPDESKSFAKKLVKMNDFLIEEIIQIKLANQFIRRRFYKSGEGWKLIYYAAPHKWS